MQTITLTVSFKEEEESLANSTGSKILEISRGKRLRSAWKPSKETTTPKPKQMKIGKMGSL